MAQFSVEIIRLPGSLLGGNQQSYLLVPETAVLPNATINGLRATFTRSVDADLLSRYSLREEDVGRIAEPVQPN